MVATETITRLVDDMDGTTAEVEKFFSVDGTNYVLDLSAKNLSKFEAAIAPFVEKAGFDTGERPSSPHHRGGAGFKRRMYAGRPVKTVAPSAAATTKALNTAIRAWATENGIPVSDRGRIPETVIDAYHRRTRRTESVEAPTNGTTATGLPKVEDGVKRPQKRNGRRAA